MFTQALRYPIYYRLRLFLMQRPSSPEEPVCSELVQIGVDGLGDAVGIEDQGVSGGEFMLWLGVSISGTMPSAIPGAFSQLYLPFFFKRSGGL